MYRLVLAWGTFVGCPIALAASRDGRGEAPTRPLTALRTDPRAVVSHAAGVEETVLGYNEHGVVAFIRWRPTANRTVSLRDVLGHRSAEEAVRRVERTIDSDTPTGDLLVCDAQSALSIETGGEVRVDTLTPGVHVFVGTDPRVGSRAGSGRSMGDDAGRRSGAGFDRDDGTVPGSIASERPGTGADERPSESGAEPANGPAPRFDVARWLYETLRPEPGEQCPGWIGRATAALGDHEHGVCVHRSQAGVDRSTGRTPRRGRNAKRTRTWAQTRIETRSAASLAVDSAGAVAYAYADGPPCIASFRPVNPLS